MQRIWRSRFGSSLQDLHLGAPPVVSSRWLRLSVPSPSVSPQFGDVHPHTYNLTLQAAKRAKASPPSPALDELSRQPHICFLTQHHPCSFCSIGGSTSDGVSPGRVHPPPLLLVLKRDGGFGRCLLLRQQNEKSSDGAARPTALLNCWVFSRSPLLFPSCGVKMGFSLFHIPTEKITSEREGVLRASPRAGFPMTWQRQRVRTQPLTPLGPQWLLDTLFLPRSLKIGQNYFFPPLLGSPSGWSYSVALAADVLCLEPLSSDFFYLFHQEFPGTPFHKITTLSLFLITFSDQAVLKQAAISYTHSSILK